MGLENRRKSGQIFDGSKLNVPGQGIKTVNVFKDILKNPDSVFSSEDVKNDLNRTPRPTQTNTKTPLPTPTQTPTNTATPSYTPTNTPTRTNALTPKPTRTPSNTPQSSQTPTPSVTATETPHSTALPTRTNTPSNTVTPTIGPTQTPTNTASPTNTSSTTPTNTPSLTPDGCFCYNVEITQQDLNAAYGNTIQPADGQVTIQYFSCDEEIITLTASTAGFYYICNRKFETLNSFGIEVLLVYTQLDEVYNNYLNPDYFTSVVNTNYNACISSSGCIPPSVTPTETPTNTPTTTETPTNTPSYTPSNTVTPSNTPSYSPTNEPTPTNTVTPTLTPNICYIYDVTITQDDIDASSGNTTVNGVVSIVYYPCSEVVEEIEVTSAGVYSICNKNLKTDGIYNTEVYLVYTQDNEAYNNYDNPSKFTSSFVNTNVVCYAVAVPTPSVTSTATNTPSNTASMTSTPSNTATSTQTPTQTPTQTSTPTNTPSPSTPSCDPLTKTPILIESTTNTNGRTFRLTLNFSSASLTTIVWGDGTSTQINQTGIVVSSKVYTSNVTDVKIYSCDYSKIIYFESFVLSNGGNEFFEIKLDQFSQLVNLESININSGTRVYGNINEISSLYYLKSLIIRTNSTINTITGDIIDLVPSLEIINISGDGNLVTGDLNNLSQTNITDFRISGKYQPSAVPQTNITGDIVKFSNYPNLNFLSIMGANTVYGDLSALSNLDMTLITIGGYNTVTGDIQDIPIPENPLASMTFNIEGNNTLSGDIQNLSPRKFNSFIIRGNNTITGDIQYIKDINSIYLDGNNTIYGNLQDLSDGTSVFKLRNFSLEGNNVVTGSLNDIGYLQNLLRFVIKGNNTVTGPVNNFITNINNGLLGLNEITINPTSPGTLTSSEVDSIINGLVYRTWQTGTNDMNLLGNCSPRTSASNAAVTYLTSIGVSVQTN